MPFQNKFILEGQVIRREAKPPKSAGEKPFHQVEIGFAMGVPACCFYPSKEQYDLFPQEGSNVRIEGRLEVKATPRPGTNGNKGYVSNELKPRIVAVVALDSMGQPMTSAADHFGGSLGGTAEPPKRRAA